MKAQPLRSVLIPILTELGLELEELEIVPAGKRKLLRVILDGDGETGRGPTLEEIATATKAISRALDETPASGSAPYTLEVSSRGVSRPLTKPAHWRRNTGRLVRVDRTGAAPLEGRITAADDDGADLAVDAGGAKGGTTTVRVEFDDVTKALVQVELNRPGAAWDDVDVDDKEE